MLRIVVSFSVLVTFCAAHAGFRLLIPNGINVPTPCPKGFGLWNGVGHNVEVGGGAANVFGAAFAAANNSWTKALCQADSDTDGKTNGQELGDPNCTWMPGQAYPGDATGHPGVCEPMTDDKCKDINKNIVCSSFPTIILPE